MIRDSHERPQRTPGGLARCDVAGGSRLPAFGEIPGLGTVRADSPDPARGHQRPLEYRRRRRAQIHARVHALLSMARDPFRTRHATQDRGAMGYSSTDPSSADMVDRVCPPELPLRSLDGCKHSIREDTALYESPIPNPVPLDKVVICKPRRNRAAHPARVQRAGHPHGRGAFHRRPQPQARGDGRRIGLHRPGAIERQLLNMPAIIAAAEVTDAQAIHPGYGFLSENADFAERVEQSGLRLHRPEGGHHPPDGRQGRGDPRDEAAGVPCVPGSGGPLGDDMATNTKIAREIGYPVIVKAAGGAAAAACAGARRGALANAIATTKTEAKAASATTGLHGEVPGEPAPRGDPGAGRRPGQRHPPGRTRLLDAAPPPEGGRGSAGARHHPRTARAQIGKVCVEACVRIGYRGAGTFNSCTRTAASTSSR